MPFGLRPSRDRSRKAFMASFLHRSGIVALTLLLCPFLAGAAGPHASATLDRAGSAHAQTYRFWSYWHADGGSWNLATTGPSDHRPADGSVEGWRFTESSGSAGDSASPRPKPSFDGICASTPARQDAKRVAVVLDYGTAAEATEGRQPPEPRTACARVPSEADGGDVLAAIAEDEYLGDGRVCGIDGYPPGGCTETGSGAGADSTSPAEGPAATATAGSGDAPAAGASGGEAASGEGTPVGAIVAAAVGGLLVLVLAGAAAFRARRSG